MKYLSFDVGIKNLAYCSLNEGKKILDWGIINLNKDPKCQCGIQKECPKTATYQINVPDNNEAGTPILSNNKINNIDPTKSINKLK